MLVAIETVVAVAMLVSIITFAVRQLERVRAERIIARRLQIITRSHL
jgi:hypothetical protein